MLFCSPRASRLVSLRSIVVLDRFFALVFLLEHSPIDVLSTSNQARAC